MWKGFSNISIYNKNLINFKIVVYLNLQNTLYPTSLETFISQKRDPNTV